MYDSQLDPVFIEGTFFTSKTDRDKNNLKIGGMKKIPNETWGNCETEVETLFKESIDIEEEVLKGHTE